MANETERKELLAQLQHLRTEAKEISRLYAANLQRDIVQRDEHGFILTGPDLQQENGKPRGWTLPRDPFLLETNIPGVFCAGDVRYQSVKRVASAVGEGSIAVQFTHRYLAEG